MSIGLEVACGPNDQELATSAAAPVSARQVAARISPAGWPSCERALAFAGFAVSVANHPPRI
jgi:hypothetical protein